MTDMLHLVPCSDRSLLVYLGDRIDPGTSSRVHALASAMQQYRHPAITDVAPSYHCLLIEYDPVRLRPESLEEHVRVAFRSLAPRVQETGEIEIPVLYGGEAGPDLDTVAAHAGLSSDEVIHRHANASYRVHFLGFSPGFGYLGGLDPALRTPRLAEPRVRVAAGSVGIGGDQTGIYPSTSPGGWQLVGRTPLKMFDPLRTPPALLQAGMSVKFVPIDSQQFTTLEAEAQMTPPTPPRYVDGKTGLRILHPGLMTTIQDLGRLGFLAYGVPTAGAADFRSLMIGNWLLGNRARTAALEITLTGPAIEFTGPVAFCLTGAPVPADLIPADGGSPRSIPGWTALLASPGDRLRIGATTTGCRAYLCIAGGFDLAAVLGSLSEDLFSKIGPLGRPLQVGDWLPVGLPLHPPADLAGRSLPRDGLPPIEDHAVIRVIRGPQASAFSEEALSTFFQGDFIIGQQSDRQGLRLQGPSIAHTGLADILSEPNPAGSIQVPANGQPILLLRNRNTAGGYTKIAVTVYSDIAVAGQMRPGDHVTFREIDLSEAHSIAWAERRLLAQIRRYLERGGATPLTLPQPPAPPPIEPLEILSPPESVTVLPTPTPHPLAEPSGSQQPPAAPSRTFRVTVAGVTYEALVEEIT